MTQAANGMMMGPPSEMQPMGDGPPVAAASPSVAEPQAYPQQPQGDPNGIVMTADGPARASNVMPAPEAQQPEFFMGPPEAPQDPAQANGQPQPAQTPAATPDGQQQAAVTPWEQELAQQLGVDPAAGADVIRQQIDQFQQTMQAPGMGANPPGVMQPPAPPPHAPQPWQNQHGASAPGAWQNQYGQSPGPQASPPQPFAGQQQQQMQEPAPILSRQDREVLIESLGEEAAAPIFRALRQVSERASQQQVDPSLTQGFQQMQQELAGLREFQQTVLQAQKARTDYEFSNFVDKATKTVPQLSTLYGAGHNLTPQQQQAREYLRSYAGTYQEQMRQQGRWISNEAAVAMALEAQHNLTAQRHAKQGAVNEIRQTLDQRRQQFDVRPTGSGSGQQSGAPSVDDQRTAAANLLVGLQSGGASL